MCVLFERSEKPFYQYSMRKTTSQMSEIGLRVLQKAARQRNVLQVLIIHRLDGQLVEVEDHRARKSHQDG